MHARILSFSMNGGRKFTSNTRLLLAWNTAWMVALQQTMASLGWVRSEYLDNALSREGGFHSIGVKISS